MSIVNVRVEYYMGSNYLNDAQIHAPCQTLYKFTHCMGGIFLGDYAGRACVQIYRNALYG